MNEKDLKNFIELKRVGDLSYAWEYIYDFHPNIKT